jgi:hypothetical protein
MTTVQKAAVKDTETGRRICQIGKRRTRLEQSQKSGPPSHAGQATEWQYRIKDEDGTIRQIYEVVKDVGSHRQRVWYGYKTALRVFDPFFTTKEEGCGTGLGLYLVESASGNITLESEKGCGTDLCVIFPIFNLIYGVILCFLFLSIRNHPIIYSIFTVVS